MLPVIMSKVLRINSVQDREEGSLFPKFDEK